MVFLQVRESNVLKMPGEAATHRHHLYRCLLKTMQMSPLSEFSREYAIYCLCNLEIAQRYTIYILENSSELHDEPQCIVFVFKCQIDDVFLHVTFILKGNKQPR